MMCYYSNVQFQGQRINANNEMGLKYFGFGVVTFTLLIKERQKSRTLGIMIRDVWIS